MPFDLQAAKQAGYSDTEIANFLSQNHPNFDVQKAIQSGYSLDEISNELSNPTPQGPGTLESGALGLMSGIPGAETVVSGIKSLGKETYPEAHQELETLKNQAWDTHPVAYGAGKTTGIVGTGLALPATATLGGAAALGAGIGAASGLDTAQNPSEMATEALKGAGTGAVLGSLGHGVSKTIEAVPGITKSMLASTGGDTSVGDIEAYLKNPEAIRSALSKEAIGSQLGETVGDIGKASGHLSDEARGMLNSGKTALNIEELPSIFDELADKYLVSGKPTTAADELALNTLNSQYDKLAQIARANNGEIPETVLRDMIDRLQSATKESTFGNPDAATSQEVLRNLGGKLNDVLRTGNTEYAEQMAPSAEAVNLAKETGKKFGIAEGQPSDVTASRLGQVGKEGKLEGEDLLNQVKGMTGQDFIDMLQKSKVKENLEAPGPGGALKTLMAGLGFGVGKMTGVPFGGIAGAAAGRYSAEAMNGGSIAKQLMDMYLNIGVTPAAQGMKQALQTFGPILVNAAKVGGNQLAATHFVLATSNPEYQELMDHAQNTQPVETNTGIRNEE